MYMSDSLDPPNPMLFSVIMCSPAAEAASNMSVFLLLFSEADRATRLTDTQMATARWPGRLSLLCCFNQAIKVMICFAHFSVANIPEAHDHKK